MKQEKLQVLLSTMNLKNDKEVNNFYKQNGWHLLRVWEHQFKIKDTQQKALDEIVAFIEQFCRNM